LAIAVAVVALRVQFWRGWEDEVEGMIRRGKGLLVQALRSSSRVVILSPAKNRREKMTPESRSTKDIFGSAAVGAAVTMTVAVGGAVLGGTGVGSGLFALGQARA
jgi:hypothetical protein